MKVRDLLKSIFAPRHVAPPDARRLNSANEDRLALSLQALPWGERGWITLSEAAYLFSRQEPEYAFGEMDDEGKLRLAEFAAVCRSEFRFMPVEGRVYFI